MRAYVADRKPQIRAEAGANSYVYDADGNRLITRDPTGAALHLGGMELRLTTATGQVTGTRYYTFNGETVAQRTPSGLAWLAADHQGTNQVTITADTAQTVTWRRQTPYGNPRGGTPTWPNKLGFVGGYKDATGLTHLGAREYDPQTGRFISVDPILDTGNPQHLNGYAYAGNNPVTISDPSGLIQPEYNDPGNDEGGNPCGGDFSLRLRETRPRNEPAQSSHAQRGHDPRNAGRMRHRRTRRRCGLRHRERRHLLHRRRRSRRSRLRHTRPRHRLQNQVRLQTDHRRRHQQSQKAHRQATGGGPPTTSSNIVEEIAKEKAYDRANPIKPTAPDPTTPKPSGPKGGGAGPGQAPVKGSCKHSFDPATPVLKADGTTEPIADIEEGEQVLAHDPETGTTQPQPVTALHTNQDTQLTDLTVRTRDGETTLYTTPSGTRPPKPGPTRPTSNPATNYSAPLAKPPSRRFGITVARRPCATSPSTRTM